jgi:hypothetical protein
MLTHCAWFPSQTVSTMKITASLQVSCAL